MPARHEQLEALVDQPRQVLLDAKNASVRPSEGRRIEHDEIKALPALGQTRHHLRRVIDEKAVSVRRIDPVQLKIASSIAEHALGRIDTARLRTRCRRANREAAGVGKKIEHALGAQTLDPSAVAILIEEQSRRIPGRRFHQISKPAFAHRHFTGFLTGQKFRRFLVRRLFHQLPRQISAGRKAISAHRLRPQRLHARRPAPAPQDPVPVAVQPSVVGRGQAVRIRAFLGQSCPTIRGDPIHA